MKNQNGILLTSDLAKFGIRRTYLSVLVKKDKIQRVTRGVYSTANYMTDERASIQARYRGAVFSHETAFYLLGLADRAPLIYS